MEFSSVPLDPATRAAMRDSRNAFEDDALLDADENYDLTSDDLKAREAKPGGISAPRYLSEGEANAISERYAGLSGCEGARYGDYDEVGLGDDDDDDDGEDAVKVKNPNLSNRLPREDFAPVVEFDDRPPLIERCQDVLKDRLKITKLGFLLDGKPVNTDKVVAAAGLLFKDEEPIRRSPPTRQRKRKKKF